MDIRLKFLGGAQSVTGSRYLLEVDQSRILVDCGLFQGLKELRLRNRQVFPVDIDKLDMVVLTHAHLDHTGYLPKLYKDGFIKPIYCTKATRDLAELILLDSGKLQEEEANFARKKGYSKHSNPEPLYTMDDAKMVLPYFKSFEYSTSINLTEQISLKFYDAGHILGSAIAEFTIKGDQQEKKIVFSGDLGRYNQPILNDPTHVEAADILLVESTYGNRSNPYNHPKDQLSSIVHETLERKGCLLIPAFSVGRTQEIINYLKEMFDDNQIPDVPVFIDSPMAIHATELYKKNAKYHKLNEDDLSNTRKIFEYKNLTYCRDPELSKTINEIQAGAIIISASGMCTGGRILHHLFHRLPRPQDTVLFVGYQAQGTRGRRILDGEPNIKIFGMNVPVHCQVRHLDGLSAHADREELLHWLKGFVGAPKQTYIVHGEKEVSEAFATTIKSELGWNAYVPEYLELVELFRNI
jgi:metallo-beta-lactamase family protein